MYSMYVREAGTLSAVPTCVSYMQSGHIRKHGTKRITGNYNSEVNSSGYINLVVGSLLTCERIHKVRVSNGAMSLLR